VSRENDTQLLSVNLINNKFTASISQSLHKRGQGLRVLQSVAVCCSVLQCTAYCSVLQSLSSVCDRQSTKRAVT